MKYEIDEKAKSISWIFEDSKNNIWVGSLNGTYFLKKGSKKFVPFFSTVSNKEQIKSVITSCIKEDRFGNIWMGAYYGGLYQYDPANNKVIIYKREDGLPSNNILAISEERTGSLWLSSDNGLCKFNIKTKDCINYNTGDGLLSNNFTENSSCQTPDCQMFFGSYEGLVSLHPKTFIRNQTISPVVFTGLKLFNRPVELNDKTGLLKQNINLTKELTLAYDQDNLTIEFAL